ncbi:TolC family protein [Shewanella sp. KX20019]|nr:TolC family protein [Shewanella sp. KX20019]
MRVACQRGFVTVILCLLSLYATQSFANGQGAADLEPQRTDGNSQQGIGLPWVLEQSLLHNIALKSFPYEDRAKEALALQAGIKPNPQLKVSVENILGTGDKQGVENAEISLALSQLIELGGKRQRRIDYAYADQKQAMSDYELLRLDVLAQSTERYYQLLRLQALQQWIARRMTVEANALEAIKVRANAGSVIQADVSKMALRLAQSTSAKQRIDGDVSVAQKRLAAMWSSEVNFNRANEKLKLVNVLPTAASVLNAIETAPQYLKLLSVERLMVAKRRMEESKGRADITVGVGVKSYDGFDDGALMVNFAMPLQFSNPNEGNILAAKANEDKANEQQRLARAQLKLTLLEVHQSMMNSAKQANYITSNVRPLAKQLLEHTQTAYQTGQANVLQLVDAQSELFTIERELIEAKAAVYYDLLALERITGQSMTLVNTTNKPVVAMEQPQ